LDDDNWQNETHCTPTENHALWQLHLHGEESSSREHPKDNGEDTRVEHVRRICLLARATIVWIASHVTYGPVCGPIKLLRQDDVQDWDKEIATKSENKSQRHQGHES
jgi:hypothetical protein